MNNMIASREFDRVLAEKVLKMKRLPDFRDIFGDTYEYWEFPDGTKSMHIPHYSENLEAAWELVEKIPFIMSDDYTMEPRRMNFTLQVTDEGKWEAMYMYAYYAHSDRSIRDTPALAICNAVLNASKDIVDKESK